MNKKIIWIIVAIIAVGGFVWLVKAPAKPGELDAFAQCINDSGAKYYGAFWCPNCKNQEARFGRSKRLLPRIECSTPDGRGQLQICKDAKVEGYPTWDFVDLPDGRQAARQTGDLPLETLAQFTGCELPSAD